MLKPGLDGAQIVGDVPHVEVVQVPIVCDKQLQPLLLLREVALGPAHIDILCLRWSPATRMGALQGGLGACGKAGVSHVQPPTCQKAWAHTQCYEESPERLLDKKAACFPADSTVQDHKGKCSPSVKGTLPEPRPALDGVKASAHQRGQRRALPERPAWQILPSEYPHCCGLDSLLRG